MVGGNWFLSNYLDRNINFYNNLEANSPVTYNADSDWWNQWIHLVVTSDSSGSQLFINNEKIGDSRLIDSSSWNEILGANFRIGNRYTSSGRLDGKIAAFRIYSDVLTESEIANNYEAFNQRINFDCVMDVWDFTDAEWDQVNSSSNSAGFYDTKFDLSDDRYRDGSDNVRIRYRTSEINTPFDLQIDRLRVDYETIKDTHKVDFEVIWDTSDILLNLMELLKYSHKTTVPIDVDVDIYNFASETWDEIESVINSLTFDNDSFTLSSGYYNTTNHVKVRFQTDDWESFGEEGFELLLDRLVIDYEYHDVIYGYLGDSQYFSFMGDIDVTNVSMYYLNGQDKIFIADMEIDPANPNRFEYTWDSIQSSTGTVTNDNIDIIFHLTDVLNNTNDIRYRFLADFDAPIPSISLGDSSQSFEDTTVTPLTPLMFNSDEVMEYGTFYGTYDFRNEIGEIGPNISFVDYVRKPLCQPKVFSDISGHKSVMSVKDNSSIDYQVIQDNLGQLYEVGIIEFWLYSNSTGTHYILEGSTVTAGTFVLRISSALIQYIDSSGVIVTLCPFNTDQWYHIRIDFNINTDVVVFYINGVEYIGTVRDTSDTGVSAFTLRTHSNDIFYVDAISYSWDTASHNGLGYNVGYNINPYDLKPLLEQDFSTTYLDYGEYVKNSVIDNIQDVLEIYAPAGQYLYIIDPLDNPILEDGSVLEWIWRVDTLGYAEVQIKGDGGTGPYLTFSGASLYYYDGSNHMVETDLIGGRWYRHKIVISLTTNSFDWYVDDELKQADCDFYYGSSYLNLIKYHSGSETTAYYNIYPESHIAKEEYRIVNLDNSYATIWKQFNSSSITVIHELETHLGSQLPTRFAIEYRVSDLAGNQAVTSTYNLNYEAINYTREVQISLSDDNIDLNGFTNREISFQDTGLFNNVEFLDAYINGFNYGTAYLDIDDMYKLSFGTENSENTLLGYSNSLISDYIYSNINPLDHVSWDVKENNSFVSVKHVLIDEDIVIINPLTYDTIFGLDISNIYNKQFGLQEYVRINEVFYYNSSVNDSKIVLDQFYDYDIDSLGIISFPDISFVHELYNNMTDVKDGELYFDYATSEIYDQLSLSNADGFFVNFTMPSIYYNHTTIDTLLISFNDANGNSFEVTYYDYDLRKFFMEDVKSQYEVDIFGLGKMMSIPLYIDFNELRMSNIINRFDLSLLQSITFTISDSQRWPGSFIQEIGDYSVLNLPYQRVGILDLQLYNQISDSVNPDENGYVNSLVCFRSPDYYDFYGEADFKIKRLDIEFSGLKVFSNNQEIIPQNIVNIEYSDCIDLNYRWNNALSPVLLSDIIGLQITMNNASNNDVFLFADSNWITKNDIDSPSGYLTKYYYSQFQVPRLLGEYNVSFSSFGTPIFNIFFVDNSVYSLNVTQELLSPTDPIYLSNDYFEIEYGDSLLLEGVVRDNDEYVVEGEVYRYNYQEALDGETTHRLDIVSPFGDYNFIDDDEFAIYYVNNELEILPLYSTLNGGYFRDGEILDSSKEPLISYVDNSFLLNIFWHKNAAHFINYDTNLLISYKVNKGRPISPISYDSTDIDGNRLYEHLIEVPFVKYDMITRDWITESDFIEHSFLHRRTLYKEIEATDITIRGPKYSDSIQTGIVELLSVSVNKSYSNEFEYVNSTSYLWLINQNGELEISNLNYSTGDIFRVTYSVSDPIYVEHPLNHEGSQISYIKVTNSTGYEFNLTLDQDFKLSNDGYKVYFLDWYNSVLKSGNFTLFDSIEIKYHAPLSRKIDLSANLLLLLQDSEGNNLPIDNIPINNLGLYEYAKNLEINSSLSLPLGGGRRLIHMTLAYLPLNFYSKTLEQEVNIEYNAPSGENLYPYLESNRWSKPLTVITIPDKVKLVMIEDFKDITQNLVVDQQFIEKRQYIVNQNPMEMLESGEEYTSITIDAQVKEEYEFTFQLLNYKDSTDEGTPVNNSVVWLHLGIVPKSESKFINDRVISDDDNPQYFESLGTSEITFAGPGDGANKMFGRPLLYELDIYSGDFSAYGPYIWTYGVTDELGMVTFNVSLDQDFLADFVDIFGATDEGVNGIDDIALYLRAFTTHFSWEEFAIANQEQYICSRDGIIYNGDSQLTNYSSSSLQDSTYVEGIVRLHKRDIIVGTNDYFIYNLPDLDSGETFDPMTIYLYVNEADIITNGSSITSTFMSSIHDLSALEPTTVNILRGETPYYADIQFIDSTGTIVHAIYKQINGEHNSASVTIDNETMVSILDAVQNNTFSIKIEIDESEFYKRTPNLIIPVGVFDTNWAKFGEKNIKIDLLNPFINTYGSSFDNETIMPFESNYDHLMGTVWVDPDFMGEGDDKERSIQDYIEINIFCEAESEEGETDVFPLREGVMLRPGNREGIMMFDIGLGPEDALLMNLAPRINLSFDISYNAYDIYNDNRDIIIYLLDLRLEKNPSSSTPNTTWSVYDNQFDTTDLGFTISKDSIEAKTGVVSLGGMENDENYGIEIQNYYDPTISSYQIDSSSKLLTLFKLSSITALSIKGTKDGQEHVFIKDTDWEEGAEASEIAFLQNGDKPDNETTFTVIYKFDFDFGSNYYSQITLGPDQGNNANASWIEFDLPFGFLPKGEDGRSFMFAKFNETIIGDGFATEFTLDYGIQGITEWSDDDFIIYNKDSLPAYTESVVNGYPRLTFSTAPSTTFEVIYGVRSQYQLGYGFQKVDKTYSDSVRSVYEIDNSQPIQRSSPINTYDVQAPSLYIALDNSSSETILELYEIPLLYGPELNCSFALDPIMIDLIQQSQDSEINTLTITFYFVGDGGYGSYYTDTIDIQLDYSVLQPDLESGSYILSYSKDLQNLYDVFGASSLDIYISITQEGNSSDYIPYIILDQFDYLCDEHFVEMYSRMPIASDGRMDVNAVLNTPHYQKIGSAPFIDSELGESPFDLLDNSEVTVGLSGLPYSSLVSLDTEDGSFTFNYLGSLETFPVNYGNSYTLPDLGLFTDIYDIDEIEYQDGFVNLYYGSDTDVEGESEYNSRIFMDYESVEIEDYESFISNGVPTSWEDSYNITDAFLTTQDITVSGAVLYHQLFDLTNDIINNNDLNDILDDISGAYFGIQLPDDISIAHVRDIGTPYDYDLSVQGFPTGDYVDGTYCNVLTSGDSYNFDIRPEGQLLNSSSDYSLEFASNGSKYIVFYVPVSTVQSYTLDDKIMSDYWAYYTFTEGFDYDIVEDPLDPYISVIDWDYRIESLTSYTVHPDFADGSSFTIDFTALDWSSIDNNYIYNGQDEFTFQSEVQTKTSVIYYGDENESFSIWNIVPENQFNDTNIFKDVSVEIWYNEDSSTKMDFDLSQDPIVHGYVYQDEDIDYYYWLNFTKIENDVQLKKNVNWTIVPNSYAFVEIYFVSDQLKYALDHTPFNYDYIGSEHQAYHITLSIPGKDPIYSNDTAEFSKYVLKIEDNYIYFHDKNFAEDGYIANRTKITVGYKYKLQPGLLDQEHFFMVVYPWTNIFDIATTGMPDTMGGRISGSSIISPFEYSLNINDTYSIYLNYRLNQRVNYEEKFEIDYTSNDLEFTYLQDGTELYISELTNTSVFVYYYDTSGEKQVLDNTHYILDTISHTITLEDDGNPIVTANTISEFYVSVLARSHDAQFMTHTFTYDPGRNLEDTLNVKYWSVINGEQLDVVPNFNSFYYADYYDTEFLEIGELPHELICRSTQINAYLEEGTSLSFNLAGELEWYDPQLISDIQEGEYLALYLHSEIVNYEALERVNIELYDSIGVISSMSQSITLDELISSDFSIRVNLPDTQGNDLQRIEFTPIFRTDAKFSPSNSIGIPHFEVITWDDEFVSVNADGVSSFAHTLEFPLYEQSSSDIIYIFNDELQLLLPPEESGFTWQAEDSIGDKEIYTLHIPDTYLDPDNLATTKMYQNGDLLLLRYYSPVERKIEVVIEQLYFQKKSFDYDTTPEIAQLFLINTNSSADYENFITPYTYNISIPLTPFKTEFFEQYKQFNVEFNVSNLEQFAIDGLVEFSHLLITVPNPSYELTLNEIAIYQESYGTTLFAQEYYERAWQYTELEVFTSGGLIDDGYDGDEYVGEPIYGDPINDEYELSFDNEPLFYNDAEEGKWLNYIRIYDENYNYFSAGIAGQDFNNEYQLHWNSTTGNFTWNEGFDRFQEYWGTQIELPHITSPNTKLYFEYCANSSWLAPVHLLSENIDIESLSVIYDSDYLLTPRYELWDGEFYENTDFDYEIIQYYSESFSVYADTSTYDYIFTTEYDLGQDFYNLSLYKIVGLYPNYTSTTLENDSVNYDITFNNALKQVSITDLILDDGELNQFDSISVILNYSMGPISTRTEIRLSDLFNQTYLTNQDDTFYSYLGYTYNYYSDATDLLLAETTEILTSDSSSFGSIDFTLNEYLSSNYSLQGYNTSDLYSNFVIYEDDSNLIYQADRDYDLEEEYKQVIDSNGDGVADTIKYGAAQYVLDRGGTLRMTEINWYKIITEETQYTSRHSGSWNAPFTEGREEVTEWFNAGPALYMSHADAKRTRQEFARSEETTSNRYYSIALDQDRDGSLDIQAVYSRQYTTSLNEIRVVEKTYLGFPILRMLDEEGLPSFNVEGQTIEEILSKTWSELNSDEQAWFEERNTVSRPDVFAEAKESLIFIETRSYEYYDSQLQEELIYFELEEVEIIETRRYIDNFVDDHSLYQFDVTENLFASGSNRWGIDEVPVKFETLLVYNSDNILIEEDNLYARTITIDIPNRFSLYFDYLEPNSADRFDNGNTRFLVSGILITPDDGVYYTSDKKSFISSDKPYTIGAIEGDRTSISSHTEAKTDGHYLYYDSDLNGFYETVYVLAPDNNVDGRYDVISVGYNYDGKHDFIPYEIIKIHEDELYGTANVKSEYNIDVLDEVSDTFKWGAPALDDPAINPNKDPNVYDDYNCYTILSLIDMAFPKDISDGYVLKDQIFELSMLVRDLGSTNPTLYNEVFRKEYASTFNIYRENLAVDIFQQVTATYVSALAGFVAGLASGALSTIVFATAYFFITQSFAQMANLEAQNAMKAKTFYITDEFGQIPEKIYINEKTRFDIVKGEGIMSIHNGHEGAYYSMVIGGDSVFGNVLTSHPKSYRGDWNSYNLDYFFITSELPALVDFIEGEEFYSVSLEHGTRQDLYYKYRETTLGYLEQEVRTQSKYELIRPNCVNGIPRYVFVDGNDALVRLTQPLSPLHQPIIVSQERYDELVQSGQYADSTIDVLVDWVYGDTVNDAFNPYQLDSSERENYKAKIPLSNAEFNYPITQLAIDLVGNTGGVVSTIVVNPSDFRVVNGNLYFYRTLEDITNIEAKARYLYTSRRPDGRLIKIYKNLNLNYNIRIQFATIIPYGNENTDSGIPHGRIPLEDLYGDVIDNDVLASQPTYYGLDTRTSDLAQSALAQATSYAISDYFNQYSMASVDAQNMAELHYTQLLTWTSTLISAIFLAPITFAQSGSLLMTGFNIGKQVITETLEEIYVDPFIENTVEAFMYSNGFNRESAETVSTLITSFREAFTSGIGQISTDISILVDSFMHGVAMDIDLALESQTNHDAFIESLKQDLSQIQQAQSFLHQLRNEIVNFDTVGKVLTLVPALITGGFGVGIALSCLDININVWLEEYEQGLKLSEDELTLSQYIDQVENLKPFPIVEAEFKQYQATIDAAQGLATTSFSPFTDYTQILSEIDQVIAVADSVLLQSEDLTEKYDNILRTHQELDILSSSINSYNYFSNELVSRGDKMSIDASNLEGAVTADPRFKLVGKSYSIDELRLDLPISFNFDEADIWLKQKFRLAPKAELKYYINGRWITLNDIKSETIQVKDTDGKFHSLTSDTTFAEVIEWVGYSLSDHIYIAETGADRKQIANNIAKSKWRFWYAQDPNYEISESESNIKEAYPGYWEIKRMWSYMFAGEFNFMQMVHTEEDIEVLDDLFARLIYPTTSKFLSDNGFISKNPIDLDKFADEYKQGYYVRKFLTNDVISKIATSNDPLENIRRLGAWSEIIDATWEADFAPAFASGQADRVRYQVTERFGMAILDLVMRGMIMIDSTSAQGGPDVHEVVDNLRTFLSNKDLVNAVERFFLGSNGRIAFFDMFSEAFKDDTTTQSLRIQKGIRNTIGRYQEANDYFDDLPLRYADEFAEFLITHDPSEITTFIENLRSRGANPFITGINIGNGDVLDGNLLLGDLSTIERKMFGVDIGVLSRASGSDRRFFDNFIAVLFDSYLASPNKGTADLSNSDAYYKRKASIVNDWASGQVFTVLTELSKLNSRISEIKPYKITLCMPSINPVSDLESILNILGLSHDLNEFRSSLSGDSLKMPSKYVYLFEVTKMLNEEVLGDTISKYGPDGAETKIRNYLTNNRDKVLKKLDTIEESIYTSSAGNGPDFFTATIDFFSDPSVLFNTLQRDSRTGYYKIKLDHSFNILFDKDIDGSSKTFTLADSPSTIKVYVDGKWRSKTELGGMNYQFNVAHKFVHYYDNGYKNGLIPAETVDSSIPFDGIDIIYQDGYYHIDARGEKHIFRNIYVCNSKGVYLHSRVQIEGGNINIRQENWYKDFTKALSTSQDKSFYVAINIQSGGHQINFLQKTIPQISEGQEFKVYLPTMEHRVISRKIVSSTPGRIEFIDISDISDSTLQKSGKISDTISQMQNVYTPIMGKSTRSSTGVIVPVGNIFGISFSIMFIPEGLFGISSNNPYSPSGTEYSLTYFKTVFDTLNPTDAQIEEISWFKVDDSGNVKFNNLKSKKFYATMLQLIQNSNDPLFNEYKKKLAGRTLNNLDICTTGEYQTIRDLDVILSEIFSYEGFTMLQLGMLSIQRSSAQLYVLPLSFHPSYMQEIANQFGFRSGNAKDLSPQRLTKHSNMVDFLISSMVSGNFKIFKVKDSNGKITSNRLYSFPGPAILSGLIKDFRGNFKSSKYHGLVRSYYRDSLYEETASDNYLNKKVILSKQKMYEVYARLIDTQITPTLVSKYVSEFRSQPDIWVDHIKSYTKIQYREDIYLARATHDPTYELNLLFKKSYIGTKVQTSMCLASTREATDFYRKAKLSIPFDQFSRDILTVQYGLQYSYEHLKSYMMNSPVYNLKIDSVISEVEENIEKTYDDLRKIFSEYPENQVFTVYFHRESASGFSETESLLQNQVCRSSSFGGTVSSFHLNPEIQGKKIAFANLASDSSNSDQYYSALKSIVYYMSKYDSFIMVQEGLEGSDTDYAFFANLREIFDGSYIIGLDNTMNIKLSTFAKSRFNSWKGTWNQDPSNVRYWKDSNTYSFYMFDDADSFASRIARLLGTKYSAGDPMYGLYKLS